MTGTLEVGQVLIHHINKYSGPIHANPSITNLKYPYQLNHLSNILGSTVKAFGLYLVSLKGPSYSNRPLGARLVPTY